MTIIRSPDPIAIMSVPGRALQAISFFSAVLCRPYDEWGSGGVTWRLGASLGAKRRGRGGYAAVLSWQATEVFADIYPGGVIETLEDERKFYLLSGYCHDQGITLAACPGLD